MCFNNYVLETNYYFTLVHQSKIKEATCHLLQEQLLEYIHYTKNKSKGLQRTCSPSKIYNPLHIFQLQLSQILQILTDALKHQGNIKQSFNNCKLTKIFWSMQQYNFHHVLHIPLFYSLLASLPLILHDLKTTK